MSKKNQSGKKKRDLEKYPALNPRLNAKTRFEVLDMDYLKKLNDAELQFLNQFMAEYVSGAFRKSEEGGYSSSNLHQTPEERRECYTRNNVRNRCGLTISNATGQTFRCDDMTSFLDHLNSRETSQDTSNLVSDIVFDEYEGSYDEVEHDLLMEMLSDFSKCIDPKNSSDKKLADSNYGKFLLLKFKNI
jgi:hypothetical protein